MPAPPLLPYVPPTLSLLIAGIHLSSSTLALPLFARLPAPALSPAFTSFYRTGAALVAPLTAVAATAAAACAALQYRAGAAWRAWAAAAAIVLVRRLPAVECAASVVSRVQLRV